MASSSTPPLFTLTPPTSSHPPKPPHSHRALHIQNLLSLLHLSILRQDFPRARRVFSLLAGCKEVPWQALWRTGVGSIVGDLAKGATGGRAGGNGGEDSREGETREEELLEGLMRGGEKERIPLLEALTNHHLSLSPPQAATALDKLEIYLPGQPFASSPTLHAQAGMCALYLSIENRAARAPPNPSHLRSALTYTQKAIDLSIPSQHQTQSQSQPQPQLLSSSESLNDHPTPDPFYTSLLQLVESVAKWGSSGDDSEEGEGGSGGSDSGSRSETDSESEEEDGSDSRSRRRRSSSSSSSSSSSGGSVDGERGTSAGRTAREDSEMTEAAPEDGEDEEDDGGGEKEVGKGKNLQDGISSEEDKEEERRGIQSPVVVVNRATREDSEMTEVAFDDGEEDAAATEGRRTASRRVDADRTGSTDQELQGALSAAGGEQEAEDGEGDEDDEPYEMDMDE